MVHSDMMPIIRKRIRDELVRKTYDSTIVMILRNEYAVKCTDAIACINQVKKDRRQEGIPSV